MDKLYRLLDHKEPLPADEIRRLYRGYWVYIVKAQFAPQRKLISGIPVIAGDCAYAGAEDGIYKQFDTDEYGEHTEMYLFTPGFISALEIVRKANA
jgi:hypothetical protein